MNTPRPIATATDIRLSALRLCVAPMMDWTDTHCRVFHRVLAPSARLYTEMVHANAVLHGDRDVLLAFDAIEHPVALQLGGSDPATLAAAARIAAESGFDEVNLNCGCPSDRVQAGRFGACLMREPALVAECVAAMCDAVAVAATPVPTRAPSSGVIAKADECSALADDVAPLAASIPVTVKCRLGVDQDNDYDHFASFIDAVAAAGSAAVIVHARNAWLKGLSPKENREVPPLRHDWAYRLQRERPALPVVLNGGIAEVDAALKHLMHVDGVMLGRAAYHDPYLLHLLHARLTAAPVRTRAQLLRAYRPYVEAQCARGVALKHITRHVLGLFHGQRGGRAFRQVLSEGAHRPGADWSLVERALALTDDAQSPRPACT